MSGCGEWSVQVVQVRTWRGFLGSVGVTVRSGARSYTRYTTSNHVYCSGDGMVVGGVRCRVAGGGA